MGRKVWQVDNIRISVAKRLLIYAFGKEGEGGYFFKIQLDQKMAEFKVWMINKADGEEIDKEDLKYFKEHFYGFNFIMIDPEECDMV